MTAAPDRVRLALAQLNPTVGDIDGNLALIRAARAEAAAAGADLVVTPELSLVGYPPEDLVLKPAFVTDAMAAAAALARDTADGGPAVIVGCPWRTDDGAVHNAALLLEEGRTVAGRAKQELPNYGVFDEKRVFAAGPDARIVTWRGIALGLPICEDIWLEAVPRSLIDQGAQVLICINGSPWRRSIHDERAEAFRPWFDGAGVPLVFVNQVGGQDELVFDGASFVWGRDGTTRVRAPSFEPALVCVDLTPSADGGWDAAATTTDHAPPSDAEAAYRASVLAVGDYVNKNGFPGVVLGLSGGIDSALTAAIAVDALGPDRVWCVMLPSRFTSEESLEDAAACADALGVRLDTLAISGAVTAFDAMVGPHLDTPGGAVARENLQSRIRGTALMALSNAHGHMVLTTGNKSEMAVGYATLYGDMNGGYNALKGLYKTEVYALARWRNAHQPAGLKGPSGAVIPERIITKAPSAELAPDQTDQDSLPPYDVLDDILMGLVDREDEVEAVIARGHDPATVARVQHLLYIAEYKRRQAAPGAKIGGKNFGRDRRYPITNRYRDRAD